MTGKVRTLSIHSTVSNESLTSIASSQLRKMMLNNMAHELAYRIVQEFGAALKKLAPVPGEQFSVYRLRLDVHAPDMPEDENEGVSEAVVVGPVVSGPVE